MRTVYYDGELHKARDHGGDGGAHDAETREAEQAEYEQGIEHEIYNYRGYAGSHRQDGLPALPERAGIALRDGEGDKADEHDVQIVQSIAHGRLNIGGARVGGNVAPDKSCARGREQRDGGSRYDRDDYQLEAEGVTHAVHVSAPVELRAVYAGPCGAAPDREVVHKQQLAHNRDAAHRQRSDLADHHVVKEAHDVCESVLNYYRQHHGEHMPVKAAVAYHALPQSKPVSLFHNPPLKYIF